MNDAHSHLIINHLPIIGLLFGIIVLLIGILAKSSVVRRVGLLLFLIASITALPAESTGEGAEEVIEEMSEQSPFGNAVVVPMNLLESREKEMHHLIHEHEEKAETLMPFMWGLIFLSLIALFLEWKKKSTAFMASTVVLLVGILAFYFAQEVGTSGGEITHIEIRKGFKGH